MFKSTSLTLLDGLIAALKAERDFHACEPYRVDGTIVGNGSQDFTKSYTSYGFKINEVPTQLIDCPGIEGNEEKFRNIIDAALKKCHLVCYVAREAKGIESTTLERIKSYLGENVEVLGVQNIPFNPTKEYDGDDYDCEMRIRIARDSANGCNIEKALLSVLPRELYMQTISISALPGLCAVAFKDNGTTFAKPEDFAANDAVRESIETLCRQQRNFLRHTTPAKLVDSSRILELKGAIESCCENAPIRIKRNAYRRLLQALREVYLLPLKQDEVELKKVKLKIEKQVDSYVRSVADTNFQFSRNMRYAVRGAVDDSYRCDVLEGVVYPHIERNEGVDEDVLKAELERAKQALKQSLDARVRGTIETTTAEYVDRIKQYTGELVHGAELNIKSISVDIPCLQEDGISFSDLGDWALNIGGYAFSGGTIGFEFGGPIGAAIGTVAGAIVGGIVAILRFFESRQKKISRLKNEARERIEECADNLYEQMRSGVEQYVARVTGKTENGVRKAESRKATISAMHQVLVEAIKELSKIERSVITLISKNDVGPRKVKKLRRKTK